MTLPSFTLTGNLQQILGDVDGTHIVETPASQAVIVLESNVGEDALITWDGVDYPMNRVVARVDSNGDIVNQDGDPVVLLAQDDGLNVRGLQWRISITIPNTTISDPRPNKAIRPWWINAPGDGDTIDLSEITPIWGLTSHATGDFLTPGKLLAMLADSGSDLRVFLDVLYG